jgi:hypothetical protein
MCEETEGSNPSEPITLYGRVGVGAVVPLLAPSLIPKFYSFPFSADSNWVSNEEQRGQASALRPQALPTSIVIGAMSCYGLR